MKAVRIYGEKDIRVEDVTIDDPKDDEVQVRVNIAGFAAVICTHIWKDGGCQPNRIQSPARLFLLRLAMNFRVKW